MSEINRLIITVILSVFIMLAWDNFFAHPRGKALHSDDNVRQSAKVSESYRRDGSEATGNSAVNGNDYYREFWDGHYGASEVKSRSDSISESSENRLMVSSSKIRGSILLKGLKLDDIALSDYKESLDDGSNEVQLLSPYNTLGAYFVDFGWVSSDKSVVLPDDNSLWVSDKDALEPGDSVCLKWDNKHGLVFVVDIKLDNEYMFTVTQGIIGNGNLRAGIDRYTRISRSRLLVKSSGYISSDGVVGVNGERLFEYPYSKVKKTRDIPIKNFVLYDKYQDMHRWFGMTDKYWLVSVVPLDASATSLDIKNNGNAYSVANSIANSDSGSFHIFVGAKELGLLDGYSKNLSIFAFDRSVDFGKLYFLAKPLLQLLLYLNKLTSNFGLAIMLLTIVVRVIMFPIANKSYRSMNQMKQLQPKIEEIKQRCGEDKRAMNQDMVKLFQKHNINPMSGCLPLLIQIPVFFALYKVLYVSIDMRHAPFYGWIDDLSDADPVNIFALVNFANIPMPAMLHIGIWPIIFGITMIIQQKMQSGSVTDSTHATVMRIMPYVLMFTFSSFPAGLVIYWSWNNVLSMLQQYLIAKMYSK